VALPGRAVRHGVVLASQGAPADSTASGANRSDVLGELAFSTASVHPARQTRCPRYRLAGWEGNPQGASTGPSQALLKGHNERDLRP
jgi:hypothetical protein